MEFSSDQLRTFLTVSNEGGFTRAARVLHLTQAAVSMQVRRLEEGMGKKLFHRSRQCVTLTSDGEIFAGYARRILKLKDEALSSLHNPDLGGLVRIGIPDDYACFLGPVLKRLSQSHPQVRVEVTCKPSNEIVELMSNSEIDLSITTRLYGDSQIPGKVIRMEPLVWAASSKHSVELEDPLPLAICSNDGPFQQKAIAGLQALGRECRIAYSSPNLTGLIAAVESGLAVGFLGKVNVPKGSKLLGPKDGFPLLPSLELELRSRPGAAVKVLSQHFTEVLSQDFVS